MSDTTGRPPAQAPIEMLEPSDEMMARFEACRDPDLHRKVLEANVGDLIALKNQLETLRQTLGDALERLAQATSAILAVNERLRYYTDHHPPLRRLGREYDARVNAQRKLRARRAAQLADGVIDAKYESDEPPTPA